MTEPKKSGLRKKLDKLRPDEVSLKLGVVDLSYTTKRKPLARASTRHMKDVARTGFAGILLQVASALAWSESQGHFRVSPTRIGAPLPGGVATSNVHWIPSYADEVWVTAFEDYGEDLDWRKYERRVQKEAKALEMAPYAEQHIRSAYPEISALLDGVRELDTKLPRIQKLDPEPGSRWTLLDRHIVIDGSLNTPDVEKLRGDRALALTKQLKVLRLKVTSGKPLEGTCDLCS